MYVAQENNLACQRDDARIRQLRLRTAGIWFDMTGRDAVRIATENPGVSMGQDAPTPDVTFEDRLDLEVDGLRLQLIAAVGETIDSMIVWLPEHKVALISNLLGPLFPHFPNLNTLRGDRYRFVEPYLQSVRRLRELQPEMLVTGRHEPIVGAELIDASLARLHDAVDWVHRETLDGMNAGVDLWTLMREIELPSHLRVGQGYGKVSWAVRTIWETYVGWFKLGSTTELYPDRQLDARDGVGRGARRRHHGRPCPPRPWSWRRRRGDPPGRRRSGARPRRPGCGASGGRRASGVARLRWRRQLLGERLARVRDAAVGGSRRASSPVTITGPGRMHRGADLSSWCRPGCRSRSGRDGSSRRWRDQPRPSSHH